MMVLYVDMVDVARIALCDEPASHRIVRLVLTEKQAALISPRVTGKSGANEFREDVIPLALQEEEPTP